MSTYHFSSTRLGQILAALAVLSCPFGAWSTPSLGADSAGHTFTVLDRKIAQERVPQDRVTQDQKWCWQAWQVDYLLRLDGPNGLVITPTEIGATIEGWVSNSRVPCHGTPKWSALTISGGAGLSASVSLISSSDEAQCCRERATLQVWLGDDPDAPSAPVDLAVERTSNNGSAGVPMAGERGPIFSLAPGALLRVRLRLVHQHFLYGMYDPLLGKRRLELRLSAATLQDTLPLDREHHVAQAPLVWGPIPEDRRDTRQFVSAPDSLHLEAHVPGNQYYRFPEQPVRYATKMRLRYWYLIAPGTEGECKARVAQYRDTPTAWKILSEGSHEECLCVVGRWVRVERVFRTEPDATTLALDFRIANSDVGELWIDDITLEPIGAEAEKP